MLLLYLFPSPLSTHLYIDTCLVLINYIAKALEAIYSQALNYQDHTTFLKY